MRLLILALASLLPLAAAEDAWKKVSELKTGAELRIIKKGPPQPVLATFDELTDENLIVVVKNEQVAIPRDQIERIDARPSQSGSRVVKESKSAVTDPGPRRGVPNESRTPAVNTSSSVSIGGKPDFETVFRRTAGR